MSTNWYFARNKQRIGPVPFAHLQQLAASGQLLPADMILEQGTPRWVPAASVEGLFPSLPPPDNVGRAGQSVPPASGHAKQSEYPFLSPPQAPGELGRL